jgi:hypothetical protein
MRWVVELPAPSGGTAATVTVDADSWAGALTHARGGSPIKKFRCEFDADNVVRVLDLSSREWYTIRPIRAVTPEVNSAPPAAVVATPEPEAQPPAPQPFALAHDDDGPLPPVAAHAPTPEVAAQGAPEVAAVIEAAPTPEVVAAAPEVAPEVADAAPEAVSASEEAAAPAPPRPTDTLFGVSPPRRDESRLVAVDESGEHQALPGGLAPPTLLVQRDQDPSESNPLAYRERVFVVPEGTSAEVAEVVARHAVTALRRSLATHPRGRYIVVAVFDHTFTTRPLRPALVEVRWKDWRGDVEVTHPASSAAAPINGTAHADASGSVDVSAVVAASASVPEESAPVVLSTAEASVEAPVVVAPAVEAVAVVVEAPAAVVEAPALSKPLRWSSRPLRPLSKPLRWWSRPLHPLSKPLRWWSRPLHPLSKRGAAPVVEAPAVVVEAAAPVVEAPAVVVEAAAPVAEAPAVAPLEPAVATLPPPTVVVAEDTAPAVTAAPAPDSVEASAAPETVTPSPTSEAAAAVGAKPRSVPVEAPSAAAEGVVVAPAAEPAGASAVTESAPPRRTPRTIARRARGKDLLGELFDALMDLSHMESADAGCKQVVQILQEHLQCDLAAVSLYDIDRDEFVVNFAFGAEGVVGRRERAKVGVASTVVKRKAGVTLASCGPDDVIHDDLRDGGGVFAPAMFRERLFALVRLHRVPGAAAFETDELDALSYVAAQLGEFLSTQSKRAAAAEFAPEPRRSQAPPRR